MKSWVPRLPLQLLFLVLVGGVWADPLWTGRNFGGRDLVAYNLPMEKAVHEAYAAGRFPIWIAEISGGRPLLPNPNVGALYPVRWLSAWFSFPLAVRLFPILHWALAAIGTAALLAAIPVSRVGQWIGGVTYALSGVAVSELYFPHVGPGMALLPWIIWAVDRVERPVSRQTLVLALLLTLTFLAGDPFGAALALLAGLCWIALETSPAARRPRLFGLLSAVALAALASAPQLIATALWVPETSRGVIGIRLREALLLCLSPWRLLELIVPYPFGAIWSLEDARVWGRSVFRGRPAGLHITLYAGAFALFAVASMWRKGMRGLRFAKFFLVIATALSILPGLLPEAWANRASPIALRNPEKFAVGLTLALALFAGIAIDGFRRCRFSSAVPLGVACAFPALAVLARTFPGLAGHAAVATVGGSPTAEAIAARELPGAIAEAGLFWLATFIAVRLLAHPAARRQALALCILTAVPVAANRRIGQTFLPDELFAPPALARKLQRIDPVGSYRTLGESTYQPPSRLEKAVVESDPFYVVGPRQHWLENAPVLWGRGTVFNDDFDRGDLARLERLRVVSRLAARSPGASVFFGNLSLRFGIRYRDQRPLAGYHPFGGNLLEAWDEHSAAFPDVRLLERWREEGAPLDALNRIPFQQPGEIVVESGRPAVSAARPGSVQIRFQNPNELRLAMTAPDPTWLFVLRGYWRYRQVTLDGVDARVVPAQLAFSAVRVPAGSHELLWKEQIPAGNFSFLGPPIALVLALVILRREPRRVEPAEIP